MAYLSCGTKVSRRVTCPESFNGKSFLEAIRPTLLKATVLQQWPQKWEEQDVRYCWTEEPQLIIKSGKLWFLVGPVGCWLGSAVDLFRKYLEPPEGSPVLRVWQILRPWKRATQRSFYLHSSVVLPRIVEPNPQRMKEKWASFAQMSLQLAWSA